MAVNAPRIKRDARGLLLLDPDSRAILVRVRDNTITGDIPLRLTSTLRLASTLTLGPNDNVELSGSSGGLVISSPSGVSLSGPVSVNSLTVGGSEDGPGLKLVEQGNISDSAYAASGAAWVDGGTPAFVADQKYLRLSIGNTVYRIPLWADNFL